MKRTSLLLAGSLALLWLIVLTLSRAPASSPVSLAPQPPPRSPASAPRPDVARTRESILTPAPGIPLAERAANLRYLARTDAEALEQLLRDLRNSRTSQPYRSVVALVLGTIDDPRIQEALATELQISRDPPWTSLLLHALGADKESAEDAIFDLKNYPYSYSLAGLDVVIHCELQNESLRRQMEPFLTAGELEVRRAATRALIHSCAHGDLRKSFADAFPLETDEGIRSGTGFALSTWAALQPSANREREDIVGKILFAARRPEEGAVRARTQEALQRCPLTLAELAEIQELAFTGSVGQQLWSLSILNGKAAAGDASLGPAFERLITPATDGKVREYAVRGLAAVRAGSATDGLLRALHDSEWNVRLAAVQGLSGRPAARSALTQTAASDSDPRVREAASEALRR